MTNISATPETSDPTHARDWIKVLANYREPSTWRSAYELAVTLGPFLALWALAWWAMSISGWLTLAISLCNAAFLLRLFAIQHDCGHGSFFKNRRVSDAVGRVLGVLTRLAPRTLDAPQCRRQSGPPRYR